MFGLGQKQTFESASERASLMFAFPRMCCKSPKEVYAATVIRTHVKPGFLIERLVGFRFLKCHDSGP